MRRDGAMCVAGWVVLGSLACVAYAYAGYPLLCLARARLAPRSIARRRWRPSVTAIVAARREGARIEDKLATLAAQGYPGLEVVVACDGAAADPSDDTPAAAERAGDRLLAGRVTVLRLPRRGKPAALDAAVAAARGEVLVLTDARQRLGPGAIAALVEDLGDPAVGAVGGELVLEPPSAYWRYEAWVRRLEGRAGSTVGVSGALYAMRRALWQPLPPETILDDVLVPMRIRRRGLRVAFEPAARAYDRAADAPREFRRKVRTLSGNLQLLALEPSLLSPWHPSWLAFLSHKLLRLAVPWALLALLAASPALPPPLGAPLVALQLVGYGLAALGRAGLARRWRLASLAESFALLNLAAVAGLARFLVRGRRLPW